MSKKKKRIYYCPHCGESITIEQLKRTSEFDEDDYDKVQSKLKEKNIEFGVVDKVEGING